MKESNNNKTPLDLIGRFLSGEASLQDSDKLNTWLADSPENEILFEEYRKVWEKTGVISGKPTFNLEEEWDHFKTLVDPPKKINAFSDFLAGPKFFSSFYRMAAVIAIAVILGYSMFYFSKMSSTLTITAQTGIEKVNLPDGSLVTLNQGAEITYSKKFSAKNRLVTFTGEGYFEIQKDSTHPFIIRSNNLSIRVIGTSFTVKANPGSPEIEIVVTTGKVAVYEGSDRKNEKSLLAGERALFNKELRQISVNENTNPNFLAWQTGKMVFDDSSITEVLDVLSSVYHRKFLVGSQAIKKCRVNVSFENQDLITVLKVLEATLDITFEINEDAIRIEGPGC